MHEIVFLSPPHSLMQPISAHQFGWEDQDSLLYVGLFTACSGLLSAFCFAWVGPLSRRVDERVLLIVVGCVPLLLSRLLMLPMSSDTPTFIGNVTQCEAEGYDASDANIGEFLESKIVLCLGLQWIGIRLGFFV